jgi:hypothetical protein
MHKGLDHVTSLEEELKGYSNRLEEAKKKVYFPQSAIVIGQSGIYVAFDDFWLENASGHFEVDLIPSKDQPQVKITISGAKDAAGGIGIRLRVDGFKLAGDKGKRIPKLKMDNMKVLVSLRANISINYDVASSKWVVTNPKNFKLDLLSFKGPYGITQRFVSYISRICNILLSSTYLIVAHFMCLAYLQYGQRYFVGDNACITHPHISRPPSRAWPLDADFALSIQLSRRVRHNGAGAHGAVHAAGEEPVAVPDVRIYAQPDGHVPMAAEEYGQVRHPLYVQSNKLHMIIFIHLSHFVIA